MIGSGPGRVANEGRWAACVKTNTELIAARAFARCVKWLAPLAAMLAGSRRLRRIHETIVSENQLSS